MLWWLKTIASVEYYYRVNTKRFFLSLCSGRMLPLRPPAGKPASLVCTYAATGHNSAVLSLDVTENLMFTGSKGEFIVFTIGSPKEVLPQLNYSKKNTKFNFVLYRKANSVI